LVLQDLVAMEDIRKVVDLTVVQLADIVDMVDPTVVHLDLVDSKVDTVDPTADLVDMVRNNHHRTVAPKSLDSSINMDICPSLTYSHARKRNNSSSLRKPTITFIQFGPIYCKE